MLTPPRPDALPLPHSLFPGNSDRMNESSEGRKDPSLEPRDLTLSSNLALTGKEGLIVGSLPSSQDLIVFTYSVAS